MPNPQPPPIPRSRGRPAQTGTRGEAGRATPPGAGRARAVAAPRPAPQDELGRAREELRLRTLEHAATQAALRATLEVVGDGLVLVDDRARVAAVNDGFLGLFGLERRKVEGAPVTRLARRMPGLFEGATDPPDGARPDGADGHDTTAPRRITLADGRVIERLSGERQVDGLRAWRFRELPPDGRDADATGRGDAPSLEEIAALDEALAATGDVHALLQVVIDAATRAAGAAFGAVLYRGRPAPTDTKSGPGAVDGAESFAQPHAATVSNRADAAPLIAFAGVAQGQAEPFDPERTAAAFDAAWSAARTLRCPDVSALASADDGAGRGEGSEAARVRSFLAVPLMARDGATAGGLFFAHPDAGMFSARNERVVEAIAARAALALDNLRLEDGLQRAESERRVLLDVVRRARGESARATHIKDEFLATLSHELRTPLTAILGWAKVLLLQHSDPATQARGLEAIARNANAQADLIETLLDMSRIVSGKVKLDLRTTDLVRVVDEALEAIRPEAEAKGIALVRRLEPAGCLVAGDAARLRQLLWNLLSNAVKFTPRQGLVEVTLARAGGVVEMAVSDTGSGIARQFLPHVFDCFRQADASTTRRHGGLGLGLAIVRQLAILHGGSVDAASEGPGRGARFVVRLPCGDALRARPRKSGATAPATASMMADGAFCETDLHGLDLLVVDDQTDARELVSQLLVECGASVRQAASAAEAIREFIAKTPDVLLSDIGMPERDGYELIREIRRLAPSEGGAVPALALTAFTGPEDAAQALAAGYQGHLPKPVQPHALVTAVAGLAKSSSGKKHGRPGGSGLQT